MNHKPQLLLLVLTLLISVGCAKQQLAHPEKRWPLDNISSLPADDITVDSGTRFHWKDIRCQLLGLKDSDDPVKQRRSLEFSSKWFKNLHYKRVAFDNSSDPLVTEDGVCVLWIYGDIYPQGASTLNTELVRAGLVEIEETKWVEYSFTVPWTKGEDRVFEWQQQLQEAKKGFLQGDKPHINFSWP